MKAMIQALGVGAALVAAFLLVLFAPWLTILALNKVFSLGIAVNIWTLLATLWLLMVLYGGK